MPLYEYVSLSDGEVLELLRPASQADAPVMDPAGKNRTFVRKMSSFATGGPSGSTGASGGGGGGGGGGCCPCGKGKGSCSSM